MEILNRKAKYNYTILKEIECGIVLEGTEIKSVKNSSVDISDCYARIKNNEVFLINMYIAKYEKGNINNHEERKSRKLLLHKNEIKKLEKELELNNYTLIPLKLYFVRGKAKILLAVAQGKKKYDKRQSEKEKTIKRETEKY